MSAATHNKPMTVLKGGLIDEYNADGQYNYSGHVEAQLQALEKLNAPAAAPLRERFDKLRGGRWSGEDHVNKVAKDVSEALNKLAPAGLYFGTPRYNSNMAGFWPAEWERAGGPMDSVARGHGLCVIGHAS